MLTENAVMLCGKDGVSYTIPWAAKPAVIAHRQRKTLLIKTDDDVECPISFAHLRIVPSRVKSLLAYYHKNPEALDRLGTEESVDDALKGLGLVPVVSTEAVTTCLATASLSIDEAWGLACDARLISTTLVRM